MIWFWCQLYELYPINACSLWCFNHIIKGTHGKHAPGLLCLWLHIPCILWLAFALFKPKWFLKYEPNKNKIGPELKDKFNLLIWTRFQLYLLKKFSVRYISLMSLESFLASKFRSSSLEQGSKSIALSLILVTSN